MKGKLALATILGLAMSNNIYAQSCHCRSSMYAVVPVSTEKDALKILASEPAISTSGKGALQVNLQNASEISPQKILILAKAAQKTGRSVTMSQSDWQALAKNFSSLNTRDINTSGKTVTITHSQLTALLA